MNRHLIPTLLVILLTLTITANFNEKSKGSAIISFIDFADFIQRYYNASSDDKSTIRNDYITWQTENGGFPAIQNDTHVVFIYYNEEKFANTCGLVGDFNRWDPSSTNMSQLESGVNFFYRQMQFDPTARLDYKFILSGVEWILDPRNPHTTPGSDGPNSELAMPQFVQPTEIIYRSNIPHGNLKTLGGDFTTPKVQVYLPPNYNAKHPYPTIYTSDGSEYIIYGSAINILDNLIADKRINPVIVVFIDPLENREDWYGCNSEYLTYLDSLIEYIDTTYVTNQSTYARLHLGDSLGGLVSTYVALERPEKFRLIGSHSGAFWFGSSYGIKEKFHTAENELLYHCWFSTGTYERRIYNDTKEMVSYCVDHGWQYEVIYLFEGHCWGAWRHTLDNMLEFFFPFISSGETPTETTTPMNFISGPYGYHFIFSIGCGVIFLYLFQNPRKLRKKGFDHGKIK